MSFSSPPVLPRSRNAPSFSRNIRPPEHRQPRRKVSGRGQRPRETDEAMQLEDGDAHDLRRNSGPPSASPLVEQFGERLDKWRSKQNLSMEERYNAAVDLAEAFQKVTGEELERLKERHKGDFEQHSRSYWKRQLQADASQSDPFFEQAGDEVDGEALERILDLQAEYDTWTLFEDLISVRHPEVNLVGANRKIPPHADYGNDRFAADGEKFRQYVIDDVSSRERLVICKWLEECASNSDKSIDILQEELEHWSQRGKALWTSDMMDTRERLKAEKRLRIWNTSLDGLPSILGSDGNLIVQQLDPDAVSRLKRSVDAQDASFDVAFWRVCLEMLRQGVSMDSIRDFCERCNQHSATVLLGAGFGPAFDAEDNSSVLARYRWRRTCRAAAAHKDITPNVFYSAVMGLLGGDASSIEPTRGDWKDLCHAFLNAQVIGGYQRHVNQHLVPSLPPMQNHVFGGAAGAEVDKSLEETMSVVANDRNIRSKTSTHSNFAAIQMSLISNTLTTTLMEQGASIARAAADGDSQGTENTFVLPGQTIELQHRKGFTAIHEYPDSLRVLAHMFIVLDYLNVSYATDSQREQWQGLAENICAAYAEYLFNTGKWLLIPLYACNLSADLAGHVMAKSMPMMVTNDQRDDCVKVMAECQMDVFSILARQTQYAMRELQRGAQPPGRLSAARLNLLEPAADGMWPGRRISLPEEAEPEANEEAAISSGQWYLFATGHWAETFEALLEIAENLLVLGKYSTALNLAQDLPPRMVAEAKTPDGLDDDVDILEDDHDPFSHPFILQQQILMYKHCTQLILAISALWNWRLAEDKCLRQSANAIEIKQSRQDAIQAINSLKKAMDPILAKGFLVLPNLEPQVIFPGPDAQTRYEAHIKRLQAIREASLPEVAIAYNSALQCAGHLVTRDNFIESLELGKTISGNEELIRCFQKAQRMRELVDALALTSKAMLLLNESKHHSTKQRGRTSKTLGIWDIKA